MRVRHLVMWLALFFWIGLRVAEAQPAEIRIEARGSHIELTACASTAYAICSLKVRGFEYLDCSDHGRCLQSAVSFDWLGEAFNPTQAGGVADGIGASSSRILELAANGESLASVTRMAYWTRVAGQSLSGHVLREVVMVGLGPKHNVIRFDVQFEPASAEYHSVGQYELLTGYMPAAFSRFRAVDLASGALVAISDGPGEQAMPVIFCTSDDRRCMGIVSREPLTGGGYGRWRFVGTQCMTLDANQIARATGCVKWNAVTRITSPSAAVRRTLYVSVGDLQEAVNGMRWISQGKELP